jgi:hypothetical protein
LSVTRCTLPLSHHGTSVLFARLLLLLCFRVLGRHVPRQQVLTLELATAHGARLGAPLVHGRRVSTQCR